MFQEFIKDFFKTEVVKIMFLWTNILGTFKCIFEKQKQEFITCLQKTQEKVLESIIETHKHILILSQDFIIQTLKNETLDDLKKATIALRYISLMRGKHNVEDNYTKNYQI